MNEKFLCYLIDKGLSENTYKSYISDVAKFQEYYMDSYDEESDEFVRADFLMYISYLVKHNYTPASINRKISALRRYNEFLVEENRQKEIIITSKDYIKVQPSIIPKKIPKPHDINKLKHFTLKDEKNSARDFCMVCLFSYGGLRESELVKLRLVDIKLDDRFLNIIGKGNKFRQVVINQTMYDALKEYMKEREKLNTKNPYLFIGQKNKNTLKPLYRDFCNRILNKYNASCKIDNLHPHQLRSFYCTNALHNAGYSIEQVANQAGHSSLNTTRRYLVTDQEDLIALANKL